MQPHMYCDITAPASIAQPAQSLSTCLLFNCALCDSRLLFCQLCLHDVIYNEVASLWIPETFFFALYCSVSVSHPLFLFHSSLQLPVTEPGLSLPPSLPPPSVLPSSHEFIMWSKIEQWLFVPVPACHWSRMNNSALVVEVGISEERGNYFGSAPFELFLKRRTVAPLPTAHAPSSFSLPSHSRPSLPPVHHIKKKRFFFVVSVLQSENGSDSGWMRPCLFYSLCVFVALFMNIFVDFVHQTSPSPKEVVPPSRLSDDCTRCSIAVLWCGAVVQH